VASLLDSPLVPSAVELLNQPAAGRAAQATGLPPGPGAALLAVAMASVPEAVSTQLDQVARMARPHGGQGEVLEGERHHRLWQSIQEFRVDGNGSVILKASILPSRIGDAFRRGEEIAATHGLGLAAVSEAATGVVRFHLWDESAGRDPNRRVADATAALRVLAGECKGSLVVLEAPPAVKAAVDVWGPVGQGLPLMRGLRDQFDPGRIVNPGRFVGGL
jgi:glycolate oxidase FAD binding subunit